MDIVGGLLICMWNYMGWAQRVDDRDRSRSPAAVVGPTPEPILLAVGIVALSYVLPVGAMWVTGLPASAWDTGFWADVAGMLGGPGLRLGLIVGGMISGFGMFNALVMSYSRLPLAMAEDGMLPQAFGKLTRPDARAVGGHPGFWACVGPSAWGSDSERLITLDILIYGGSLVLEFVALVALRVKEPELHRPFQVPGGLAGAIVAGVFAHATTRLLDYSGRT